MKVLIATPLYPPDDGGPATRAAVLERALPQEGHKVALVYFGKYRHLPKGVSHIVYLCALLKKAFHSDVIYVLDPVSVGLPAMLVSTLLRKPYVLSVVGDYAWEQGVQRAGVKENLDAFVGKKGYPPLVRIFRFIQKLVALHASAIIVPSQYLKKIVGLWGGTPDETNALGAKTRVVYNAFNAHLPVESKECLRGELNTHPHTVISVGRFVPWKGFFTLMDVMVEVRKVVPGAVLEIAGSGDRSAYESYAKEKGYDFVMFLGVLPRDLLMRRIKAADCFALNTGYEGLSHVILETMALETPVVTTDVGGNPELFVPHALHWLAHYDEKPLLVEYIIRALLNDTGVQKDVSAAAMFVSDMTEERMVKETIQILEHAVK